MSEDKARPPERMKKDPLERCYYKISIMTAVAGVILGILTLFSNSSPTKTEPSSVDNGSASAAASTEGDYSPAAVASVGGDGNTAVSKSAGGDYYDYSGTGDVAQEETKNPEDYENHKSRLACAADLIEKGKDEDALTFLMKYLKMEGLDEETRATIQYNCGLCCLHIEDYHQAVTYLEDAAEKSSSPYAYYNLGCAYIGREDYPSAEAAFKRALDLSEEADSPVLPEEQRCFRAALLEAEQRAGTGESA